MILTDFKAFSSNGIKVTTKPVFRTYFPLFYAVCKILEVPPPAPVTPWPPVSRSGQ